jgi:hypothetical protein
MKKILTVCMIAGVLFAGSSFTKASAARYNEEPQHIYYKPEPPPKPHWEAVVIGNFMKVVIKVVKAF